MSYRPPNAFDLQVRLDACGERVGVLQDQLDERDLEIVRLERKVSELRDYNRSLREENEALKEVDRDRPLI